jgi:HAD superfamily hydrolase (TIGR01509 family)
VPAGSSSIPGSTLWAWGHAFAAVVAREDVTHGKPAPDLYLAAARRLGVPPDRCLAVDDAREGVASARAASMHVITMVDGHLVSADGGPEGAAPFASEDSAK